MNLLVVMFDSLRPDFLGCLGNPIVQTPNFDAFAAESCVFTNAIAEFPITVPSRTALLTGNYTFTNRPWRPLREGDVTLTEVLKQHGYLTAAFSDTPFRRSEGMDRGFDEFKWLPGGKCHNAIVPFYQPDLAGIHIPPGTVKSDVRFYLNTLVNRAEYMKREGMYFPDLLTREALKWLDAHKEVRFLLWLDYFDPHEPWDPPEPYASMYDPGYTGRVIPMPRGPESDYLSPDELNHIRAQYAGCVTQVDDQFGKLRSHLEQVGLWEKTIVVLLSDHGEPLGEHGEIRKFNIPVYDELSQMVFMIRVPGLSPIRTDALVQNTELPPTMYSLLGIEADERMDGVDLTPLMHGETSQVRERAYSGAFQVRASIRTPEWKFIDNRGGKPNELFHLTDDPGEKVNLIGRESELARKLHEELWEWGLKWSKILDWKGELWDGKA